MKAPETYHDLPGQHRGFPEGGGGGGGGRARQGSTRSWCWSVDNAFGV